MILGFIVNAFLDLVTVVFLLGAPFFVIAMFSRPKGRRGD
jgi:hypothetical protein